jgi:hypothetical protein
MNANHEPGCEGCQILTLQAQRDALACALDDVEDWIRRRAEHGGQAHLVELREIVAAGRRAAIAEPKPEPPIAPKGWLQGLGGR